MGQLKQVLLTSHSVGKLNIRASKTVNQFLSKYTVHGDVSLLVALKRILLPAKYRRGL